MRTEQEQTDIRDARDAAGAAYAAAATALVAAFVELAAHDEVCTTELHANRVRFNHPGSLYTFLDRPPHQRIFARHEQYANAHPELSALQALIQARVQELREDIGAPYV